MDITPRETILKKIRAALIEKTPQPYPSADTNAPLYTMGDEGPDVTFAQEFTKLQGKFVYCENEAEWAATLNGLIVANNWLNITVWEKPLIDLCQKYKVQNVKVGPNLDSSDVGLTLCEALIARTGTVMLSSKQEAGRTLSIYPPVHITVAYTDQLVPDIKDGIKLVMDKYEGQLPSSIVFATGPSRTADIEKTLVLGAHGPKEVYVLLIERTAQTPTGAG